MRSDETQSVPQLDAGTAAVAAELGHHTGLLEQLVGAHARREHLEDAQTFAFPTGAASAFVFTPAVPGTAEVEIEGWQSGSAAVPLYVLDGQQSAAQAAALVGAASSDFVPVLFAIPTTGIARVRIPQFSGKLTVCSLGTPTAVSLVTVKVRACA